MKKDNFNFSNEMDEVNELVYANALGDILKNGEVREDRTGTGTISKFGTFMEFDLRFGFPILSGKKIHWNSVITELLWFISGDTNIKFLKENGVSIWDEWANANGDLGPVYGSQWRNGDGVDQLKNVIESIKEDPYSRRHIVSSWNVGDLDKMALPPCHLLFQFYVTKNDELDMLVYQRSADFFLGVPFNISSYSALLMIVAKLTNKTARQLKYTFGDSHIYLNHVDQVKEYLGRVVEDGFLKMTPELILSDDVVDINTLKKEHFNLVNYDPMPWIQAPISV